MPHAELIARCMRRGDEDVRSVALLSLCEATLLYEERRSADFPLFARCYIRQRVLEYLIRQKRRQHAELSSDPPCRQDVDVERLMSCLPPDDFQIFVKFAVKNQSVKRIANVMGCSQRLVYRRIAECVSRLKAALQEVTPP